MSDMDFQLFSSVFRDGEDIPVQYSSTRRGRNISPPLGWKNPPSQTKSFALTVIDLDIPFGSSFTHWVIYNIPLDKRELSAGIHKQADLPDGTIQGKNGFWQKGYLGPAPIRGRHRYRFTIYALDTIIEPNPKMNKKRLLRAIGKHILSEACIIGEYSKKK